MERILWKIRKFFWRIKNTWSWTKLAWNIKWYEYNQIYEILKFSIQKTINYFENSKVQHVGIERDLYYMRLCIKLIDRIQFDYYEERAQDELEKRWGKYVHGKVWPTDEEHIFQWKISRELEKTEEDSKRYTEDFKKTYAFWHKKHEKAKSLLYKILHEKIERWWI